MLASASPEALIGPIAAATTADPRRQRRRDAARTTARSRSPRRSRSSAALYPGRIDLGIGRASGTDPITAFALQRDRRQASPDDFPQQLAELLAYLEDELPEDHPFHRLSATLPGRPELPEPWLLGSSPQSAIWAGELGLPYAFADFINPGGAEIAALYRERFPGRAPACTAPRTAVAAWVLCAPTDEEAQHLASQQPDDADAAAPRAADPGAARRRRRRSSSAARASSTRPDRRPRTDRWREARDHRLAREGARRARATREPSTAPRRRSS